MCHVFQIQLDIPGLHIIRWLGFERKKNTSVYSAQLSESQRIKATFIDILYVCNVIETVLMHDIILKTRFTTFRSVIKIS